ncbi:MAG: hypothetical protein HQ591_00260 [candidate division Zixibacteria bacterium]|nr:hypothetical protein [Candidatus Tariuqbacter arcticus]
MLPIYSILLVLTVVGILAFWAFRYPNIFLYLFLLGLPFDHFTIHVGVLNVSISDIALVLLLLAWLFELFFKGKIMIRFPGQIYLALMLLVFVIGATMLYTEPPKCYLVSFSFSVKVFAYILLLQLITDEKQYIRLIIIILIGALLSTFLALYQQYAFVTGGLAKLKTVMPEGARAGLNTNLPLGLFRPPAGMNREAAYGIYLSFTISILLSMYFFRLSRKIKIVSFLPLILFSVILIMNDTRAVFIGILLALIVTTLLSNTHARYAIVIIICLFPLVVSPLYDFLFHHREASLISRREVIIPVFEYVFKHPFGGGIRHFIKTSELGIGAHSSFLQLMTYGGIGALSIYLFILISVIVRVNSSFRSIWKVRWSGSYRYALFCMLFAAFICTIVQSELIHPRATNKDHWVFLAIFYLSPLIIQGAKREEKEYFQQEETEVESKKSRRLSQPAIPAAQKSEAIT